METTLGNLMVNGKNKFYYVYIMEYYSAIKRNKLLIRTTAWMNFKSIILSERNWTHRLFILITGKGKATGLEGKSILVRTQEWRKGVSVMGTMVFGDEMYCIMTMVVIHNYIAVRFRQWFTSNCWGLLPYFSNVLFCLYF